MCVLLCDYQDSQQTQVSTNQTSNQPQTWKQRAAAAAAAAKKAAENLAQELQGPTLTTVTIHRAVDDNPAKLQSIGVLLKRSRQGKKKSALSWIFQTEPEPTEEDRKLADQVQELEGLDVYCDESVLTLGLGDSYKEILATENNPRQKFQSASRFGKMYIVPYPFRARIVFDDLSCVAELGYRHFEKLILLNNEVREKIRLRKELRCLHNQRIHFPLQRWEKHVMDPASTEIVEVLITYNYGVFRIVQTPGKNTMLTASKTEFDLSPGFTCSIRYEDGKGKCAGKKLSGLKCEIGHEDMGLTSDFERGNSSALNFDIRASASSVLSSATAMATAMRGASADIDVRSAATSAMPEGWQQANQNTITHATQRSRPAGGFASFGAAFRPENEHQVQDADTEEEGDGD